VEPARRTPAQRLGDAAEDQVAARLVAAGWTIRGRNVHAGRGELDLIAIDPGPPAALVFVEVRWRGRREFGLGEESVDRRKRARVRAAAWRWLEEHEEPGLPIRFDVVIVEPGPTPASVDRIRHHRAAF
jgi:putative endonuclease